MSVHPEQPEEEEKKGEEEETELCLSGMSVRPSPTMTVALVRELGPVLRLRLLLLLLPFWLSLLLGVISLGILFSFEQ